MPYTEQQIRGLAINFLRQHYKMRPRSGTSGTEVVHKPHYYKGVTIDARLAYQKPNLEWFTATVEASSVDTAHEVLYRVNYFRIGVHALLIALGVLIGVLALAQVQGESLWQEWGRPGVYLLLLQILLVVWAVSGALLSRLEYYRYIYAIAQFIRFHADAQWVAYDEKIFARLGGETRRQRKRREKYFHELERQCLLFGFGLMEVGADRKVKWLIEPSHLDQFRGKRSKLPFWVTVAGKAPPVLQGLTGKKTGPSTPNASTTKSGLANASPAPAPLPPPVAPDGMIDPMAVESYLPMRQQQYDYVDILVPATPGKPAWYKNPKRLWNHIRWSIRHAVRGLYPHEIRRRPGYYELPWQVITGGLLMVVTAGVLMFLQSQWTPERRPGDIAAAPNLRPLEPAATPEQSDATPGVLEGEYDAELTAAEYAKKERELYLSPEPLIVETAPPKNTIHYLRFDTSGIMEQSFGCGPLGRVETVAYVVSEGDYPTLAGAQARAAYITNRFGIPAAVIRNDCLTTGVPGFLLYVGYVQPTGADASLMLRRYERRFGLELEVTEVE